MARRRFHFIIGLFLTAVFLSLGNVTYAQDGVSETTLQGRCAAMEQEGSGFEDYPECATSPNECESDERGFHPLNCVYLEEPLGGQTGFDLYVQSCFIDPGGIDAEKTICQYRLWYGEFITGGERGPLQAILAYEPGKEFQGPFPLLYSYLGVVYNFLSGIIIAVVVFIIIIAGVEIITAGGDAERATNGRKRITNALIGMAIWFLASVILYTINPTFFRF